MPSSAIEYPSFVFDSDLTRAIIELELERARADLNHGSTPPAVYRQLKELFQLLTSIMSARIEGNRTSLLDAVSGAAKQRRGSPASFDEGVEEILNIQRAVEFIEREVPQGPISNLFIRELHNIAVAGLTREGDRTPGAYRLGEVSIGQSNHTPPWPADVPDHMNGLINFIADEVEPQKQLLQVAIAHHRFLWIHPFGNGNGRVSRLLTYSMLVKQGFTSSRDYRAVNPTAVFGANRAAYYDNLEKADDLSNEGVVDWSTYVLSGLNSDLKKLAKLSEFQFVAHEILLPAIERMSASGRLTAPEARALSIAATKTVVSAGDLEPAFPGSASSRSQAIRSLLDRGLLAKEADSPRKYHLAFLPNDLTVHLVARLDAVGLLPTILADDPI